MPARITIVGGGSSHWTPTLLVDFANSPALQDATVTLYDADPLTVPPMVKLADHIAERRGIALSAVAADELDRAVDGAQIVLTTLAVGGFGAMTPDVELPFRYGVRQPVGDSVGPGGIMRSLRNVPVVVEIAQAVERVAPDAWLVNVSNPLTALCRGVTKETSVRAVGLCNELVGMTFVLSLLFDVGFDRIDPVVAGVNHLPLITSLTIDGADGFEMLRTLLERPGRVPTSRSGWTRPRPCTPASAPRGRAGPRATSSPAPPSSSSCSRGSGYSQGRPTPTSRSSSPGSSRRARTSGGTGGAPLRDARSPGGQASRHRQCQGAAGGRRDPRAPVGGVGRHPPRGAPGRRGPPPPGQSPEHRAGARPARGGRRGVHRDVGTPGRGGRGT